MPILGGLTTMDGTEVFGGEESLKPMGLSRNNGFKGPAMLGVVGLSTKSAAETLSAQRETCRAGSRTGRLAASS